MENFLNCSMISFHLSSANSKEDLTLTAPLSLTSVISPLSSSVFVPNTSDFALNEKLPLGLISVVIIKPMKLGF